MRRNFFNRFSSAILRLDSTVSAEAEPMGEASRHSVRNGRVTSDSRIRPDLKMRPGRLANLKAPWSDSLCTCRLVCRRGAILRRSEVNRGPCLPLTDSLVLGCPMRARREVQGGSRARQAVYRWFVRTRTSPGRGMQSSVSVGSDSGPSTVRGYVPCRSTSHIHSISGFFCPPTRHSPRARSESWSFASTILRAGSIGFRGSTCDASLAACSMASISSLHACWSMGQMTIACRRVMSRADVR